MRRKFVEMCYCKNCKLHFALPETKEKLRCNKCNTTLANKYDKLTHARIAVSREYGYEKELVRASIVKEIREIQERGRRITSSFLSTWQGSQYPSTRI